MQRINTLNEKPLHEALKRWYAQPGDRLEEPVDGFIVDIVHGDLLVEIQTGNLGVLRRKLEKLLVSHPVRLVYPIALEKWIFRQDSDGKLIGRRKSPKRGCFEDVFSELVRLPRLLTNPHFSLELLLIQEEEIRRHDPTRAWRRQGWITHERRLLKVIDRRVFKTPRELHAFIPAGLAEPFSTSDLAKNIAQPRWLAQKMVYCLRSADCVTPIGKRGNSILYCRPTA